MADIFRLNAVVSVGVANALAGLRQIDAQGRVTAASMGKVVSSASALTGAISSLAGMAAMARSLTAITTLAGEFELKLQSIRTVVSQSGESLSDAALQYKNYHDSILDLAATVGKMPAELAEASYELGSSGFENVKDNMEMLRISAMAATAGLSDTKTAASALISVLNSYSMQATEAAHVNDVMFQTLRYGILQYGDLARYIGNVAPIAASAGISFEEVSASLATITKAGLNASKATIGLRGAILKLLNNTERGKETLANYGLEVNATTLEEKGLIQTLREIDSAIGGNTDTWAKIISDNRALTATLALVRNGGMEAVQFLEHMNNASVGSGRGMEAFEKIANSFAHQMDLLRGEWQKFLIVLGEDFLPILRAAVEGTVGFVKALNSIPSEVRSSVAALAAIGVTVVAVKGLYNAFTLARLAMDQYTVSAAEAAATSNAVAAGAEAAAAAISGAAAAQGAAQTAALSPGATVASGAAMQTAATVGAMAPGIGSIAGALGAGAGGPAVVGVKELVAAQEVLAAKAGAAVSEAASKSAEKVALFVNAIKSIPPEAASSADALSDVVRSLLASGEDMNKTLAGQVKGAGDLAGMLDALPTSSRVASNTIKGLAEESLEASAGQLRNADTLLASLKTLAGVEADGAGSLVTMLENLGGGSSAQQNAAKLVDDLSDSLRRQGADLSYLSNLYGSFTPETSLDEYGKAWASAAGFAKGSTRETIAAVDALGDALFALPDDAKGVKAQMISVFAGLSYDLSQEAKKFEGMIDLAEVATVGPNSEKLLKSLTDMMTTSAVDSRLKLSEIQSRLPLVSEESRKAVISALSGMADELDRGVSKAAEGIDGLASAIGSVSTAAGNVSMTNVAPQMRDLDDEVIKLSSSLADVADAAKGSKGEILASFSAVQAEGMSDLVKLLGEVPEGSALASDSFKDMAGEVAKATVQQVDDIAKYLEALEGIPEDTRKSALDAASGLKQALGSQASSIELLANNLISIDTEKNFGRPLQVGKEHIDSLLGSSAAAADAAAGLSQALEKLPEGANYSKDAFVGMAKALQEGVVDNAEGVENLLDQLSRMPITAGGMDAAIDVTDALAASVRNSGIEVSSVAASIELLPDVAGDATKAAVDMSDAIGKAATKNADDIAELANKLLEAKKIAEETKKAAEKAQIAAEVADILADPKKTSQIMQKGAGAVDTAGDVAAGAGGLVDAGVAGASIKASSNAKKAAEAAELAAKKLTQQQGLAVDALEDTTKAAKGSFPTFKAMGTAIAGVGTAIVTFIRNPWTYIVAGWKASLAWLTGTAGPAISTFLTSALGGTLAVVAAVGALAAAWVHYRQSEEDAKSAVEEADDVVQQRMQTMWNRIREFGGKGPAEIKKVAKSSVELTKVIGDLGAGIRATQDRLVKLKEEGKLTPEEVRAHATKIRQASELKDSLIGIRDEMVITEAASAKANKAAAEDQRKYLDNLKNRGDALGRLKEKYDRGEFATAEDAAVEFAKLPKNLGVREKDPSKQTPAEKEAWKAYYDFLGKLDAERYKNAIDDMQVYLGKMDEGIKVRREQNRGSLAEEIGFYRAAKAEATRLENEAVKLAGTNLRKQNEAHQTFFKIRLGIERRLHEARVFYAKDEMKALDAKIRALQAEVALSQHMVKNAMRNNKDLIGDNSKILALIDREYTAEMALLAAQEKKALLEAKRRKVSPEEMQAIAKEFLIKREDVQIGKEEQILALQTRQAEKMKQQGDLRVKAMGGQISAIDDAIERMKDVDEGESVNIDAVERLMKKKLELVLASIEQEKNGALAVARARKASEEEIADIIMTAELEKQSSIRDTAEQLRALNRDAEKTKPKNFLGNIYQGLDAMLEARKEQADEWDKRTKARRNKSSRSVYSLLSDQDEEANKLLRDAYISETSNIRASTGVGLDSWDNSIGNSIGKWANAFKAKAVIKGKTPEGVTKESGEGGVSLQEVLVNVKFDVNGQVSVASDSLSEGTALAVIDDLAFNDRLGGRGGSDRGRTMV